MQLYEALAMHVTAWREENYSHEEYSAIAEILDWASDPDVPNFRLQIQHNEAFNLAVEHLGMTRTKTDAFFDGTLGKKLVKIVPFNHPVTPLDLEEVKNELKNRPEEERDIVVVGLGREVAVHA